MIRLKAPLEMGICVESPETMIGFYRDVLGFEMISDLRVPAEKSSLAGFIQNGYRIIRFQTNLGERVKLVHPSPQPLPRKAEDHILSHQGKVFLTFIVEDLKTTVDELISMGAVLRTEGKILEVRQGVFLSILDDPEGNHLEFVEYANLEAYRPDLFPS